MSIILKVLSDYQKGQDIKGILDYEFTKSCLSQRKVSDNVIFKDAVQKSLKEARKRKPVGGVFGFDESGKPKAVRIITDFAKKDAIKNMMAKKCETVKFFRAGEDAFQATLNLLLEDFEICYDKGIEADLQKIEQNKLQEKIVAAEKELGRRIEDYMVRAFESEVEQEIMALNFDDFLKEQASIKEEKKRKAPERDILEPLRKCKEAEKIAKEDVSAAGIDLDADIEKALMSNNIKIAKKADVNSGEEKRCAEGKKSTAAKKADAEYEITLPEEITIHSPLKVFECNTKMKEYCEEVLGKADLHIWSIYDEVNATINILIKYVRDGNQNVPIKKIRRDTAILSKGCLNFLYEHAGMDATIVRFVGQVLNAALPLLDNAERGRTESASPIEVYRDVVGEIIKRSNKIMENNQNGNNVPVDVIYKVVNKTEADGKNVNYVCTRGSKALETILKAVASPFSRLDFLRNMKFMTEYAGITRDFLEISAGRQYDYGETGGKHWVHLRIYEDILQEVHE